jgi:hypothetical protein
MNAAYVHVVFNHLPIMGVPLGALVLALGLWARNGPIERAALLLFVLLALGTLGVFFAGLAAENWAEHVARFDEAAIDAHLGVAMVALGACVVLGVASLAVLLANGGFASFRASDARPLSARAGGGVLALAVVACVVLGVTGELGGRIRHTEFGDSHAASSERHDVGTSVDAKDAGDSDGAEGDDASGPDGANAKHANDADGEDGADGPPAQRADDADAAVRAKDADGG